MLIDASFNQLLLMPWLSTGFNELSKKATYLAWSVSLLVGEEGDPRWENDQYAKDEGANEVSVLVGICALCGGVSLLNNE